MIKVNDYFIWNKFVKERTDDEQVKQWIFETVVVIGSKTKFVKKDIWDSVMLSDDAKDKCNMLVNAILKLQDELITESEYMEIQNRIIDLFFSRIMMAKYGGMVNFYQARYDAYKIYAFNQNEDVNKYIVKNFSVKEGE